MEPFNYKKFFLTTMIAALVISALMGIWILIAGDMGGEVEMQVFGTTLALGGYSLGGLCCATIYNKKHLRRFSIIGMVLSVVSFILTMIGLWTLLEIEVYWQTVFLFMILSISLGHSSLLLLIDVKTKAVRFILMMTFFFISIVSLMFVLLVFANFNVEEYYWRLLGVFLILDALGTLLVPIMNKMSANTAQDSLMN